MELLRQLLFQDLQHRVQLVPQSCTAVYNLLSAVQEALSLGGPKNQPQTEGR